MKGQDFLFLLPEISVFCAASFILLLGAFIEKHYRAILYYLSHITLWSAVAMCFYLWQFDKTTLFANLFVVDPLSQVLKLFSFIITSIVLLYSKRYLLQQDLFQGEYFSLTLFSVLGLCVLVSSRNFLTLYLGLELLTMPLYTLVAMNRKRVVSSEAAIKYLVLGAMASGMLLYGISLLYGVTGTIEMPIFAEKVSSLAKIPDALWFGIMFVIVGIAFKLGAVPFHVWIPDVYQGAPLSVTLFVSTLPKFAAFGMACRIFIEAFASFTFDWKSLLAVLAMASLTVGNLAALYQTNIKRLLGYSAISHIGFILLGFVTGATTGFNESLFYLVVYGLMLLGVLGSILALSTDKGEIEEIEDLKGLSQRNPWIAGLLLILLLSLAGIPPTAGFSAKFFILQDLLNHGRVGLATSALLLTVVGCYYYLKIIKVMYFDEYKEQASQDAFKICRVHQGLLSLNGLLMLWLGLFPMALFNFCIKVIAN